MINYNLCTACFYYRKKLILEDKNVPKHCANIRLRDYFGEVAGGFP